MTPEEQDKWRTFLCTGHTGFRWFRRLMRVLPTEPRCQIGYEPFGGIGGKFFRLIGHVPSRKDSRLCDTWVEKGPAGGVEIEVGVLFADVRGFTALSERESPQDVARLLDRFYGSVASVLCKCDAFIDKMVGDEVMALFLAGLTGPGCRDKMASAGESLLRSVGYGSREGPWLPLGVGMDFGLAFVGNVGAGEVKDFTAVGDVVNTAARLQAEARAGQMVISERVYKQVSARYPHAVPVELTLKGKSEPVAARIVEVAVPLSPAKSAAPDPRR